MVIRLSCDDHMIVVMVMRLFCVIIMRLLCDGHKVIM